MIQKPIQRVLAALEEGAGQKPTQSGNSWMALCPAHDDSNPSLSITEAGDWKVLIHCHRGCKAAEVVSVLDLTMQDLAAPSTERRRQRKIVAEYDYRDATGKLLFQKVRFEPKSFAFRRPDGNGGWIWDRKGVGLVLYRLPKILTADPTEPVLICEGEADADALASLGLLATTNPEGAKRGKNGNWRREYNAHLKDRQIVLLPDNDDPGRARVEVIAESLVGQASCIKVVHLAGLPRKGDVSDWLAMGGTKEELLALASETPDWQPACDDNIAAAKEQTTQDENSMRAQMVAIGRQAELFHAPGAGGEIYGTIRLADHLETYALGSLSFKHWLTKQLWQRDRKAPNSGAIDEAINTLSAIARFDGPSLPVAVRVAEYQGVIYLDLANDQWQVVQISKDGWRVDSDSPVRFIRPRGMDPLPIPARGGSIGVLWRFVNVRSDWERVLVVAWLAAAFRPQGPFPILAVFGEHGSAKSTACRIFRRLVDPNIAPLRAEPRDERDLVIAARNSWVQGFDNLSKIKPGLSDALCRLSTGGGFSTRELYSDGDEILFQSMRPILLNGITEIVTKPDLLDRAITLRLEPITPDRRRTEESLWVEFERARPAILGALLDAVVEGLRNVEDVTAPALPRLADFAKFSVAAEAAFGLPTGTFLAAYTGNREDSNEATLEASPVGSPLLKFMEGRESWTGTCSELLTVLESDAHSDERTRKQKTWPKTGRAMRSAMDRVAPNLRALGINVHHPDRTGKCRPVELTRTNAGPSPTSPSSLCGSDPNNLADPRGPHVPDGTSDMTDEFWPANCDRHREHHDSTGPEGARDESDGRDGSCSASDQGPFDREIVEI